MVKFEKIRFKNFLSSGGQFTELELNKTRTTLIVGENGAGKSTLLDALCFALYGKAFRNINKPQLISSINQKDCLVEVEFSIGRKKYLVARGIKPTIFDIYIDGQLVDQSAASRDYQAFFEEQILKINYRSFTQIVILGTASFTPFMQLPAAHRREIIEDILDIKIFSQMNTLLKDKMAHLKDKLNSLDSKLNVQKEKTLLQKSFIKTLEERNKKKSSETLEKLEQYKLELKEKNAALDNVNRKIKDLNKRIVDKERVGKEIRRVERDIYKLNDSLEKISKDKSFYEKNNTCPTCEQIISAGRKEAALHQHGETEASINKDLECYQENLDNLIARQEEIDCIAKEISKLTTKETILLSEINSLGREIASLKKELERDEDHNLNDEKRKLKEMAAQVVELANAKSLLNEEKQYQEICAVLLKDTGIKTTVIRQYLPVINKFVNKFLSIMDFFVHFELDEAFNETIKSRHRDDFSYASFSEGEKQRINLALLFTWRSVAKMKNSVNTNLLILDEVFDSSLDANGTEYVLQLLNALGEHTNIFVISHKSDQLVDKFDSVIRFEKHNNFSKIAA